MQATTIELFPLRLFSLSIHTSDDVKEKNHSRLWRHRRMQASVKSALQWIKRFSWNVGFPRNWLTLVPLLFTWQFISIVCLSIDRFVVHRYRKKRLKMCVWWWFTLFIVTSVDDDEKIYYICHAVTLCGWNREKMKIFHSWYHSLIIFMNEFFRVCKTLKMTLPILIY